MYYILKEWGTIKCFGGISGLDAIIILEKRNGQNGKSDKKDVGGWM